MQHSVIHKTLALIPALCFAVAFGQAVGKPSGGGNVYKGGSAVNARPNGGNAVATYVYGGENASNASELATDVVAGLARSAKYSEPRRGARDFFAMADREQRKRGGKLLGDRDFCRIGSDYGVQFLCIIDIERSGRANSVWARIIDLDDCREIATAEYTGAIRTRAEIREASGALSRELLNRRVGRRSIAISGVQTTSPTTVASSPAPATTGSATAATSQGNVAAPFDPSTLRTGSLQSEYELLAAEHKAQQQDGGSGLGSNSGTFTDKRDGKTYKTVKIGGKTWMAQNLNYKTGNSWCYGNEDSKCQQYGRLYDWNTAKGACPSGWRLPSRADWDELVTAAGGDVAGKKLKAASGWSNNGNGTDEYGFSALPGGFRDSNGYFIHADSDGFWWTVTENGSGRAYFRSMGYSFDYVYDGDGDVSIGLSVRCVGD